VSDDLFKVVLGADLFLEIDVLFLQPGLQVNNLFIGLHIRDGKCDLIRNLLQQLKMFLGVLVPLLTPNIEGADALAAYNQWNDTVGIDAPGEQCLIVWILAFFLEVLTHYRLLVIENPGRDGLCAIEDSSDLEEIGAACALDCQIAEGIGIWIIDSNDCP